jgi:hypothetical protein
MDYRNFFATRNIALYGRLDYIAMLLLCAALLWQHRAGLDWLVFFIAIAWQDAIGYYPAALLYYLRRPAAPGRRRVPVFFYYLYNAVHGVLLNLAVLLAWMHVAGGWRWEMLAIPVHLCIDRGVFGLFYKSRKISFIPVEHHAYAEFRHKLEQTAPW